MKHFTLEDLRKNRARVTRAARTKHGCVVVDENGRRLFSLWIPSTPLSDD